jgi:hypothetical protein
MNKCPQSYKGLKLVDIPSGLGGVLPAVISYEWDDKYSVICLHDEYFTNWMLQIDKDKVKPMSYTLTDAMKAIIESRLIKE